MHRILCEKKGGQLGLSDGEGFSEEVIPELYLEGQTAWQLGDPGPGS